MASRPPTYRLAVASRIVAAAAGGYAAAALLAVVLAVALPLPPSERAVAGALAGIAFLPFVAIACFRTRSAGRAWAMILLLCAGLAGSAASFGWRG